jgi:predicted secreted Zn-dependent protease
VKHAGMALPDPIASAKSNYEASTLVNVHLLAALKGNEEFHSADHKAISREVRSELKVRKKAKDDSGLKSILSKVQCDLRRTILQGNRSMDLCYAIESTVHEKRTKTPTTFLSR